MDFPKEYEAGGNPRFSRGKVNPEPYGGEGVMGSNGRTSGDPGEAKKPLFLHRGSQKMYLDLGKKFLVGGHKGEKEGFWLYVFPRV